VKQAPFVESANGSPIYMGDQTRMNVRVGEERSIPINRTGTDAFVPVTRADNNNRDSGVGFFQVFDDLIAGLNGSKGNDIRRGIGELDTLKEGVSLAQAQIGTNLNVVDQQTSVVEDTTLNLKTTLSSIEDLDYASAITKMNQQMLSLEAAQSSFAKISQLNLFNYIK
jgi:flagellar hook-associated protein 3 FlgL